MSPGSLGLRALLEGATGKMTVIAFSSQIFGLYAGLVNATPLLGGWLGDRVLGQTRTIVLGAVLMTVGHLAMTSERLFLVALSLLVLGAGCIKGNMAVQIGNLYGPDDPRRTRGFGIYMFVRNLGAFAAPLICGTLGETLGWDYGFGVAAACDGGGAGDLSLRPPPSAARTAGAASARCAGAVEPARTAGDPGPVPGLRPISADVQCGVPGL